MPAGRPPSPDRSSPQLRQKTPEQAVAEFMARNKPWSPLAMVCATHALCDRFSATRFKKAFRRLKIALNQKLSQEDNARPCRFYRVPPTIASVTEQNTELTAARGRRHEARQAR